MTSTRELEAYLERTNWLGGYEDNNFICSCSGSSDSPTTTIIPKTSVVPLTKSPETVLPSGNRVDGGIQTIQRTESVIVAATTPVQPITPIPVIPPIADVPDPMPLPVIDLPVISDPLPLAPGDNINYLDGLITEPDFSNPLDELATNIQSGNGDVSVQTGPVENIDHLPVDTTKPTQAGGWLLGLLAVGLVVRQLRKKKN